MTAKNRLLIGWREAELRAKLDGSYEKQDDLRHERDALRAENERLTNRLRLVEGERDECSEGAMELKAENERLRRELHGFICEECLKPLGRDNFYKGDQKR